MAIELDTHVERIDLTQTPDLDGKIRDVCARQADRDQPRRLAATFQSQNQVILIFQRAGV
ncbi:MAG: hypothetical protein HY270_12400 [Deltaproteobacteria bacterium]|nr:hypothetical protein [Deltaproteobacteria bacterium]